MEIISANPNEYNNCCGFSAFDEDANNSAEVVEQEKQEATVLGNTVTLSKGSKFVLIALAGIVAYNVFLKNPKKA